MRFFDLSLDDKAALKIILRGAAIPGIIVLVCALVALTMAVFEGNDRRFAIEVGVAVGLFFSLWGGIEISIGLLFMGANKRTNIYLFLGYVIVWIGCIALIFHK